MEAVSVIYGGSSRADDLIFHLDRLQGKREFGL